MKKYVMMMVLMIASGAMYAQRNSDAMDRAAKRAERMKTELSLDEVQYKAVKAINEEYAGKLVQLRSDSALTKEAKRELMKSLQEEKTDAVKKVLTSDQNSKWAAYQKTQARKHKARGKKRTGDHALQMQKNLSLTDEQTSKIKAIDQEFVSKFKALRNDSTVAKEDVRLKVKQLRDEYPSKVKQILTEDQFRKWEQRRQKGKH